MRRGTYSERGIARRQQMGDAFKEGWRARRWEGVKFDACPYPATHKLRRRMWEQGWLRAAYDFWPERHEAMRLCDA